MNIYVDSIFLIGAVVGSIAVLLLSSRVRQILSATLLHPSRESTIVIGSGSESTKAEKRAARGKKG